MRISLLLIFLIFFSGCYHKQLPEKKLCGSNFSLDRKDTVKVLKVKLSVDDDNFFYLYKNDYVIFLTKRDVIESLEKNKHLHNFSDFIREIKNTARVDKYVDLRQYSFSNTEFDLVSRRVVMELLQQGRAKVIDMRYGKTGQALSEISIVYLEGGGQWRLACDSTYGLLFEINDFIE